MQICNASSESSCSGPPISCSSLLIVSGAMSLSHSLTIIALSARLSSSTSIYLFLRAPRLRHPSEREHRDSESTERRDLPDHVAHRSISQQNVQIPFKAPRHRRDIRQLLH